MTRDELRVLDSGVGSVAFAAYCVLRGYGDGPWPTQHEMVLRIGLTTDRSWRTAVKKLEHAGFIKQEQPGLGSTNRYHFPLVNAERKETSGLDRKPERKEISGLEQVSAPERKEISAPYNAHVRIALLACSSNTFESEASKHEASPSARVATPISSPQENAAIMELMNWARRVGEAFPNSDLMAKPLLYHGALRIVRLVGVEHVEAFCKWVDVVKFHQERRFPHYAGGFNTWGVIVQSLPHEFNALREACDHLAAEQAESQRKQPEFDYTAMAWEERAAEEGAAANAG